MLRKPDLMSAMLGAPCLTLQRREFKSTRGQRDSTAHVVEEIQVVLVSYQLEQAKRGRHVRAGEHERILFAQSGGDVRTLLDGALLRNLPVPRHTDTQDLGTGRG